jgi:hypothetical protein
MYGLLNDNINVYFLSIIRVTKSSRMIWAGNVAGMRQRGMHIGFWWESQMEMDH